MATTKKAGGGEAAENIEEWIFCFDKTTGELLRVEKVNEEGKREEISEEEYATLFPEEVEFEGEESEFEAGYYQAVSDYEGALAEEEAVSAEEAAYYQGMADYEESLGYE